MKRILTFDRSQGSLAACLGVDSGTVAQIQALADANRSDAFDLYEQLASLDLSEPAWLLAIWYVGYCHGLMGSSSPQPSAGLAALNENSHRQTMH
jgi:hypothetical protein